MLRMSFGNLRDKAISSTNLLIALAFALSGLMPIILSNAQADAAQLTSRSVLISNSAPLATGVDLTFTFTTATSTPIRSMVFQFCQSPLGTCTLPGTDGSPLAAERMDVSYNTASLPTNHFTGTTVNAFTEQTTNTGGCTDAAGGVGTATMYCVTRSTGTSEAAGIKTFTMSGVRNPQIITGSNNEQVYARITTYSDAAFATAVDAGVVAASIVNQLTVTGRVQERLVFCVFALDDADGSSGTSGSGSSDMPTNCAASSANEGTNVDIGVIDNNTVGGSPNGLATSPVDNSPPTSQGNDRFGAAIVNTNASLGVQISYYANADTGGTNETRAFRVPSATCNVSGTSVVDQCFISASSSGETVVAGTERFGMQMVCVANSTSSSIGTTSNLGKAAGAYVMNDGTAGSVNSAYNSGITAGANTFDDTTATDNCENTNASAKFAWNPSSTAANLISSLTVVDDEMVKFRYGATASATTPTGTYTVASTYIATPTF